MALLSVGALHAWSQAGLAAPSPMAPSLEPGLFDSDAPLAITLKGRLRGLLNDRVGEPRYFPVALRYPTAKGRQASIPVQVRTRGDFRRMKKNCDYPPLLIRFAEGGSQEASLFSEHKKLKLVMPCRGDAYVVREWMAYRLYNLITPMSFRARLVKVTLEDGGRKAPTTPFYGILLEERSHLARRTKTIPIPWGAGRDGRTDKEGRTPPPVLQPEAFLTMALFQYLIGNTDWSAQYPQNLKLVAADSVSAPVAVPYDFDLASIVAAPYAKPALNRPDRRGRYRGECVVDPKAFDTAVALYNGKKSEIRDLYADSTALDQAYIDSTLKFIDEFYASINDPNTWRPDFLATCFKAGGNAAIEGSKGD